MHSPRTVHLDRLPDWGPGVSLARQRSCLLLEELPASRPSLPWLVQYPSAVPKVSLCSFVHIRHVIAQTPCTLSAISRNQHLQTLAVIQVPGSPALSSPACAVRTPSAGLGQPGPGPKQPHSMLC